MKANLSLLRKLIILLLLFSTRPAVFSQTFTSSIDIGSSQQEVNPLTTFNAWVVTNITSGIQNAYCSGNTTAASAPPSGTREFPIVNQPARVVSKYTTWPNGTYLSCFPYNTIYTERPAQSNFTNTAMTIRRSFRVCGNTSQQVIFLFNVASDDAVNSIVLDKGTGSEVTLFAGPPQAAISNPVSVYQALNLAPGIHTIDIVSSDFEDVSGVYYFTPLATQMQWNPLGVSVVGTISAAGNVLVNANEPVLDDIIGKSPLCIGETHLFTNSVPGGTWSSSNPAVASVTAGGLVTGVAVGTAVISYSVQVGTCYAIKTFPVTVIDPPVPVISPTYTSNGYTPNVYPYEYPGINTVCIGWVNVNVNLSPGASAVWTRISPNQPTSGPWSQTGNNLNFTMWSYTDYIFEITATNCYGQTTTKRYLFRPDPCTILPPPDECLKYNIYPNPAKGKVIIGETNKPAPGPCPLNKGVPIAQINVYSLKGVLLKRVKSDNVKQASIDVADLMNGHYYIEVMDRTGYKEKHLLIVQK